MQQSRSLHRDLLAVAILAALAYLFTSLYSYDPADPVSAWISPLDQIYRPDLRAYPLNDSPQNACGRVGALVADLLMATFGVAAWYVLFGLAVLAVALLIRGQLNSLPIRIIGWVMSLVGISAILHRLLSDVVMVPVIGAGGYLGALSGGLLHANFGSAGSLILMAALTLVGVMFWTDYFVFRAIGWMLAPVTRSAQAVRQRRLDLKNNTTSVDAKKNVADDLRNRNSDHGAIPVRSRSLRDDLSTLRRGTDAEPDDDRVADEGGRLPSVRIHREEDLEDDSDDGEIDEEADDDATEETANSIIEAEQRQKSPQNSAGVQSPAVTNQRGRTDERQAVMHALNRAVVDEQPQSYELPQLELLDTAAEVNFDEQRDDALRKASILERTFQQFGFNVKVVDIETGPVIAQYELELEAGLRLAKITNLADDLAIALRVPSVRIVSPIPGKNTVGIEVPNERRQVVRLREVMERGASKASKMKIPLFVGQDVRGEPLVVDLATLPHLLIAGRTGTGKSVCLNAIIASILMTRRPDEVRMLMIDPKMVELSGYGRLPHLMHPVVTDMRKAEAILAWAVDKMEERYALLARAGVRHITSYNQLGEQELLRRLQPETDEERNGIPLSLPFIVIVADEMADLMMTSGKEVQQHIIRLAQKSRAVGIHLILATQKPTVDVITGLIKSNLPARIAFQVATRTDSQVVLDCNGAERLLGNGDLLFLWPGTSTLLRGQGTYLTDEEIISVTNAVSTGEQNFVQELVQMRVPEPGQAEGGGLLKNRDEVYAQAVEIVIREGRGSVSLLQRALGIGYGRAARLIDFMEQDGVVGVYAGAKSREVIMTMSQWMDLQQADALPAANSPPARTGRTLMSSPAIHPLSDRFAKDEDEHELDEDSISESNDDDDAEWTAEAEDSDDESWGDASDNSDEEDQDDQDEEDEDYSEDEDDSADEDEGVSDETADESSRVPFRLSKPPHRRLPRSRNSADDED